MPIGNIEFQKYCKEHNIPGSHRIWAWGMWQSAYKLGSQKLLHLTQAKAAEALPEGEICPHVYRACRVAGCDCDGRDVFCEIRNGTGKLPLA